MLVMHTTNDFNFCMEFSLPLSTPCFQLFNCHFLSVRKYSSVNITKTTLSKEIRFRETISCPSQFFIGEGTFRETKGNTRRWWSYWNRSIGARII